MKRSSRPTRAPSTLSESTHERLSLYSLAASAAGVSVLALASPTQAKIIFTSAHIKITPNHKLALDLNHDGVKDFELVDSGVGSSDFLEMNALQPGNALAQANTDCNPSVGVAALKAGAVIGKGQTFSHNLYCMAQYIGADGGSLGSWAGGVKNRFLGMQFTIEGRKHFGWARLSVSTAPYIVMLTGYAYETIPNKPIIAGKTEGPDENSVDETNPATLNESTPQPASLGLLAIGSPALSIWRREESAQEGN
jgi:hypothetical protein